MCFNVHTFCRDADCYHLMEWGQDVRFCEVDSGSCSRLTIFFYVSTRIYHEIIFDV